MRVITGTARGRVLRTLEGEDVRPTTDRVKEAVFSIIQFEIEGRRVLDLFAGSGQLGIEALSRGAREAVFVDARRDACQVVRENLSKTRLAERAQVVQMDYLSYLGTGRGRFDLVFLDPPYAEVFLENALKRISEIDILTDGGIIICEARRERQLPDMTAPYVKRKEYSYGKVKVCIYTKENA